MAHTYGAHTFSFFHSLQFWIARVADFMIVIHVYNQQLNASTVHDVGVPFSIL